LAAIRTTNVHENAGWPNRPDRTGLDYHLSVDCIAIGGRQRNQSAWEGSLGRPRGGAYVPTPVVGMYAPLGMGAQTCQRTARLPPARHVGPNPSTDGFGPGPAPLAPTSGPAQTSPSELCDLAKRHVAICGDAPFHAPTGSACRPVHVPSRERRPHKTGSAPASLM
jgi:hypothetical protein